jgi:mannose-6-phosphate isomerase-like protein (cupin superfamily)
MPAKPYEIMRWDSPKEPDWSFLTRMMAREGLEAKVMELSAKTSTPEMKFEKIAVRVLVSGQVQFAFPGYGVIELDPGDILEINPGVLHDIMVLGSQPAMLLEAFKE